MGRFGSWRHAEFDSILLSGSTSQRFQLLRRGVLHGRLEWIDFEKSGRNVDREFVD